MKIEELLEEEWQARNMLLPHLKEKLVAGDDELLTIKIEITIND